MSNSIQLQDAILRAIDTLASARIDKIEADKTIVAQISKCVNSLTREYRLGYNGGTIIAYAQEDQTYTVGQEVYVLVPQADMTKRKIILGISTPKDDDSNITFVSAALSDYNVIGRNAINNPNDIYPVGLHSYLKHEYKVLYSRDDLTSSSGEVVTRGKSPETQLTINVDELENNLKQAEAVMMEATFFTRLPDAHAISKTGKYGLEFVLAFSDRDNVQTVTKKNDDGTETTEDVAATKYYSYVIDSNNMTGNPFHFYTDSEQYQIFPIDTKNFLYIDSIIFFEQDFVQEDDSFQADDVLGWGSDIFVKDIEFYGLKHIEAQNGKYKMRVSMPDGNTFHDITSLSKLEVRGTLTESDTLDLSGASKWYWFKEDNRVPPGGEGYQGYGGAGWYWLEDKSSTKNLVLTGMDNRAFENNYKVVVVYQNELILKDTFTMYNEACERELSIYSNLGAKFSFDRGTPELTCMIDNKSSGFENGKTNPRPDDWFDFYWSKVDSSVGTTLFNESREKAQARYDELIASGDFDYSELSSLRNLINSLEGVVWDRNVLTYPVKGVESSATFKCSVFTKDTEDGESYNIGSTSITLQNEGAAAPTDYYIVIENGDQVFQYSESGVAPNDSRYTNPLEIKPLTCHFFDPAGIEVNNKTYTVKWKVPLEDTMITTPSVGMETNYANGKKEWYASEIYPLNGWTEGEGDQAKTVSGIAANYDYFAVNNQILCIVDYDDREFTQYTNLTFTKVGNNGTNGTDLVTKISVVEDGKHFLPLNTLLAIEVDRNKTTKNAWYNTTPEAEMSQKMLDFDLYQRNERLSFSQDDVKWSISGGNASNNNSKYLSMNDTVNGVIDYSQEHEYSGKFRNQIIRGDVKWEGNDYYGFYPIPIIEYNNINSTTGKKPYHVYINNNETLKSITYNSDGRYPIYNKNQGVTIRIGNNDDVYKYVVWSVEGGMPRKVYDESGNYFELHPSSPDIRLIRYKDSKDGQMKIEPSVTLLQDGEVVESQQEIINSIWYDDTLTEQQKRDKIEESNKIYIQQVKDAIDDENTRRADKLDYPEFKDGLENYKTVYILPNDTYNGECTNNVVVAKLYDSQSVYVNNGQPEVTVYVPIYMSLNTYELHSLNAWDGNHVEINEDENYILAPQIGAGEKDSENRFTGIVMGKATFYDVERSKDGYINDDNKRGNLEPINALGLIGYSKGKQSIFLDAETGSATFGLPEDNNLQTEWLSDHESITKYNEGRIKLVPGGTSSIGNWKIGSRILYNLVKDSRATDHLVADTKLDEPYQDLRSYRETDGQHGRYKVSIPHDAEGILLSSEPSYISIKGRMFNNTLDTANEADYTDLNVIVQPFDSFELQLDPNNSSLFTVYRHTSVPEDTTYTIDDEGNIRLVTGEIRVSDHSTSDTIYSRAVYRNGRIVGWKCLEPAVRNMGGNLDNINRFKPIQDIINGSENEKYSTYVIARPLAIENDESGNPKTYSDFINDKNYFFELVNRKDNPNDPYGIYYIPELVTNDEQQKANVDIFSNTYWHREAVVGINNQGRFYTNALRDGMTSLNIGSIGAFGVGSKAKLYGGAAFETGTEGNSKKLIKFFTDYDGLNKENGHLYISAGSTLTNEYARSVSTHFKDMNMYVSNSSTSKEPSPGALFRLSHNSKQTNEGGGIYLGYTDSDGGFFSFPIADSSSKVTRGFSSTSIGTQIYLPKTNFDIQVGKPNGTSQDMSIFVSGNLLENITNSEERSIGSSLEFNIGNSKLTKDHSDSTYGKIDSSDFEIGVKTQGSTSGAYIHGGTSDITLKIPFSYDGGDTGAGSRIYMPSTGETRWDCANFALSTKSGYIHTNAPKETILYTGSSDKDKAYLSIKYNGDSQFDIHTNTGEVASNKQIGDAYHIGVQVSPCLGTGAAWIGGGTGYSVGGYGVSLYTNGTIYAADRIFCDGDWIWARKGEVWGNDFKFNDEKKKYSYSDKDGKEQSYTSNSLNDQLNEIYSLLTAINKDFHTMKAGAGDYWNQLKAKIDEAYNHLPSHTHEFSTTINVVTDVTQGDDTTSSALTGLTNLPAANTSSVNEHYHTYSTWYAANGNYGTFVTASGKVSKSSGDVTVSGTTESAGTANRK